MRADETLRCGVSLTGALTALPGAIIRINSQIFATLEKEKTPLSRCFFMVGMTGIEPAASRTRSERSTAELHSEERWMNEAILCDCFHFGKATDRIIWP